MAEEHKSLAQVRPAAATPTLAYTTPALTKALLYSVVVCNTSAGASKFRLHKVPSGGPLGLDTALYYDVTVPGNDTFVANISVTCEPGETLHVESETGDHTFTLSGMEIT
jgi:hypothetical protein